MYILSPRSFHKSGKYGHSLFTTLSKSWLIWAASHETYDWSWSYTEFYGNPTNGQTGGWTWFSIWDVPSFIRRRMSKKMDVCLQVWVFHSSRWSEFQIHIHTLLQLITALNHTSKFIFSSFPGLGESKYSGDYLLSWTLLYCVPCPAQIQGVKCIYCPKLRNGAWRPAIKNVMCTVMMPRALDSALQSHFNFVSLQPRFY